MSHLSSRLSDRMEQFCSHWKDFQHSKKQYNTLRNDIKCSVKTLKTFKLWEEKFLGFQIWDVVLSHLGLTFIIVIFCCESLLFYVMECGKNICSEVIFTELPFVAS